MILQGTVSVLGTQNDLYLLDCQVFISHFSFSTGILLAKRITVES